MAAFMVGKSLKDRRQNKAIEDLFDKADKNGNGKISVEEYVNIFSDHGIQLRYDLSMIKPADGFSLDQSCHTKLLQLKVVVKFALL